MVLIPFRTMAAKGILRDPSPYELDLNAWSGGANVRFHINRAERSPIFRQLSLMTDAPAAAFSFRPSTGVDQLFVMGETARLWQYANGTLTEVSNAGLVQAADPQGRAWTASAMGDVCYLNRPDRAPLFAINSTTSTPTQFATLTNWPAGFTCRSLRAFSDYMVALNVNKNGPQLSTLVKWSDLTLIGQVPGSWDYTDPTKNAGENPLEEVTSPLVDGLEMRGVFVIYAHNEIWSMTPVDSNAIFSFQQMFSDGGMIAPNCGVEVAGRHYVFGPTDIYVHDGITKQSIINGRNRDYIFRNLNASLSEVFFVKYLPTLDSILFAYCTGSSDAAFPLPNRCNQGAIYDVNADTWAFVDLPNVGGFGTMSLSAPLGYSTATPAQTYATIGSSYFDTSNGLVDMPVCISQTHGAAPTAHRILAYDFASKGRLALPAVSECIAPSYLQRIGIDLNQEGAAVSTYKTIRRVFPLVTTYGGVPVTIQFGGSETQGGTVNWGPAVSFNPAKQYKIDGMKGGRFMSIMFTIGSITDYEVAGFDADIVSNGKN